MIHSTGRRRRGTVLVLFALIVFALLALAALVIDLGFVRLTQQEMQTGTDTAALEGLRWRDAPTPASWGLSGNPDQDRRQLANQLNALQYDADYNLATTDGQYGAGPVISFTGGVTQANALQSVTGTSVYKPDLQLNDQDNEQDGDMLAGTYTPLQPPQPPTEARDYTRNDFTPSPAATAATAPSFLVRMRRTNDPRETASNTSGVSSVGPSLPLLFGRGSMIAGGDPNAGYNVRFHGLTVRSTSIADAIPARSVGVANPAAALPGATPFALGLGAWNGLTAGQPNSVIVQAGGQSGLVRFLAGSATITLGQDVTALAGGLPTTQSGQVGYVPIFSDNADLSSNLIVGFGYVQQWSLSAAGNTLTVTPGRAPANPQDSVIASTVAAQNATTAMYPAAWPSTLTSDQLTLILRINSGQATPDPTNPNVSRTGLMNPLLAPALVR